MALLDARPAIHHAGKMYVVRASAEAGGPSADPTFSARVLAVSARPASGRTMYCAETPSSACEIPEVGFMSVTAPKEGSHAFAYDVSASLAKHRSEGTQKSFWVQLNDSAEPLVVSLRLAPVFDGRDVHGVEKVAIYAEPWPELPVALSDGSASRLSAGDTIRALAGALGGEIRTGKKFVSPGEASKLLARGLAEGGEDEKFLTDMMQQVVRTRTKKMRVRRR